MKGWIGVTDNDWFESLSQQAGIDVVNFCQPGRFAEFTEVHQVEADFKAKVEAEFNKMI
jgi:hypothetical protein